MVAPAMNLNEQFGLAIRHAQQRQFGEAERICRSIIAADPNHFDALHCLSMITAEAGRFQETVELLGRVLAKNDRIPQAHYNLAVAHEHLGALTEAAEHYRRALALNPNYPQALANLGGVLSERGETRAALEATMRSLALQELPNARFWYAKLAPLVPDVAAGNPVLLAKAIAEAWGRSKELAGLANFALLSDLNIRALISRITNGWPSRPPVGDILTVAKIPAIIDNALLRAVLENTPAKGLDLERFLTVMRLGLLEMAATAADAPLPANLMRFFCALARQCFINGYVFSTTEAEIEKLGGLRAKLSVTLHRGGAVSGLWPVAVGAYLPLHAVAHTEVLLSQSPAEPLRAVLLQQIAEPIEERRIRETIPALTAIKDDISLKVRDQYEVHPYPCWTKIPLLPPSYAASARSGPQASAMLRAARAAKDVLVAGCGTGQHPIETALRLSGARVLAIDLSRTSLAYAQRKAAEFGTRNLEFAQADILELGSLGRSFDLIESMGVLHHLRDPWAGWEALLQLLRPGGLMAIALYSKVARRNINEARRFITDGGYGSTSDDIRLCRQRLLASDNADMVRTLLDSSDFFDIGSCRDLLFHVQEHQMTLPEIKAFLAGHDLQFLGFGIDAPTQQRFESRHADPATLADLDCWHAFEAEFPDTFLGMYQFMVRRAAV